MHTNLFAKNRKLHNLQLPILISKKLIISDMHHRAMYMYINFQQNQASRSVKTCTQIYLQIIMNCIIYIYKCLLQTRSPYMNTRNNKK